ncbi:MAG: glutamyl-tRNA reductase [Bryobacterales bacterium]|nr:glutamyl-tRNA reductase [Bryobacterales bacterium]
MKLLITGVNHRTAPVDVRERLAFHANALPGALEALRSRPGMMEGLILSTCNRVEIAATIEDGSFARNCLEQFLSEVHNIDSGVIRAHLYHYEDRDAIRHLFRVASSLDSMVVGEPQILGQLKQAYAAAKERGAVSGFLDIALTRAFNVAKRVRSETEIGQSAVSVSYAAVELAREIFGSLKDRRVIIVGAGKMSELAARHLRRSGATRIAVTNRTHERAVELSQLFHGSIVPYDQFTATLPEMDIVIASSGAPHYILTKSDMKRVIEARRNRPMFLIDIAVPRNIDPAVNDLENIFLYDIDDLQRVVEANLKGRSKVAVQAEEIIAEEVDRLLFRLRQREMTPVIISVQEQLERIRTSEIEKARGRLGALTAQQEEAIDAMTRAIMNKIAHGPIAELRRHAAGERSMLVVETIRKIFRLDD